MRHVRSQKLLLRVASIVQAIFRSSFYGQKGVHHEVIVKNSGGKKNNAAEEALPWLMGKEKITGNVKLVFWGKANRNDIV